MPPGAVHDSDAPVALVSRAIVGLGRRGQIPMGELADFLQHPAAAVRIAALRASASLVKPPQALCRAIISQLDDGSPEVRREAIRTVASLELREAVPKLLGLTEDERDRPEAIRALAILPDPKALNVYLKALEGRDPEIRRAGKSALLAICESVRVDVESRARSGQFSGPAAEDIERVLARFVPSVNWMVIGPFPRNSPQSFADPTSIDFNRPQVGAMGRVVTWKARRGDPTTGRVTIDDLKGGAGDRGGFGYDANGSPDLAAFAYTEFVSDSDRTALLMGGSSGTITVSVNGSRAYHADNNSGRAYSPDDDLCRFELKKGVNRILVRTRQGIGAWSFGLQISDQSSPFLSTRRDAFAPRSVQEYAMSHLGDAKKGAALFFDPHGIGCAKCHSAGGRGSSHIGPDLSGLALKYDKAEIIRSVLEPSNRIATGYQTVVVAKMDGTVHAGLLRAETATHLDLIVDGLETIRIPSSAVEDRRISELSFMPSGLADPLKPSEFADLIAYLSSLKD